MRRLGWVIVVLMACGKPPGPVRTPTCPRPAPEVFNRPMLHCADGCWQNPLPSGLSYTSLNRDSSGRLIAAGYGPDVLAWSPTGETSWHSAPSIAFFESAGVDHTGALWLGGSEAKIWRAPLTTPTRVDDTGFEGTVVGASFRADRSWVQTSVLAHRDGESGAWVDDFGAPRLHDFFEDTTGTRWALGDDSLHREGDGGWSPVVTFTEPVFSVAQRGTSLFIGAARGVIYEPFADGGVREWKLPIDALVTSLDVVAGNQLIASGGNVGPGTLHNTTTSGFVARVSLDGADASVTEVDEALFTQTLLADGGVLFGGHAGALYELTPSGPSKKHLGFRGSFERVAVSGASAWAVGEGGALAVSTGSGWQAVDLATTNDLLAVAAIDTSTAIVVGDSASAWRITGGTAQALSVPVADDLRSVWSDERGVLVLGNRGFIGELSGDAFTSLGTAPMATPLSITRTADGVIWVAGLGGTQRLIDGSWQAVPSYGVATITTLKASGCGVWGTTEGALVYFDGAAWNAYIEAPVFDVAFTANGNPVALAGDGSTEELWWDTGDALLHAPIGPLNFFSGIGIRDGRALLVGRDGAIVELSLSP